ncbi:MAG: hypothetical protein C4527_17925 [Candidatus Omnitrophota bacterium]|jgi:thimet oligopeptidase|nr:MAG: hypothetical protein C4527_17925 [Candidatus Omnitrophota bacterium]
MTHIDFPYDFIKLLTHPLAIALLMMLCVCILTESVQAAPKNLKSFQDKAKEFHSILTAPAFEKTPEAIQAAAQTAIDEAKQAGDGIANQNLDQVTFAGAFQALDALYHKYGVTANRISIIKNTSTDEKLRDTATEEIIKLQDFMVEFSYREDIYRALKAFDDSHPQLEGEDAKLVKDVMLEYKRLGFDLPSEKRKELETLKKELSKTEIDFRTNITKATQALKFTKEELEGVPESFLNQESVKTGDDEYTVMANITWHYQTVMENAKKEATRKTLFHARFTLAKEINVPLIAKMIELRAVIAEKLGYRSWADYRMEDRMAKNEKTVRGFLTDIIASLQPKFEAELQAFAEMKARETGEENPAISKWDWRYYRNRYMKEKYEVDTEALKVYFPFEKTRAGMFHVYETIFGLKIEPVDSSDAWHEDVTLHAISDAKTGEPLGLIYLDMFPRPGKFNHFAMFDLIQGKQFDYHYQRPTAALICNFPPASGETPSLLTYDNVETLFHEFGHGLHELMTRAKYAQFSGTSVPRDFVEVPSQVLEYWLESKQVLDTFAADYRDPSKKFPAEILDRIVESNKATIGTFYRRQFAFGMIDMAFHAHREKEQTLDVIQTSNKILGEVFLPVPDDTSFVTYFGHLAGYDAGYYGYAWADVICADLATMFEKAPQGFLDPQMGMKLRREIFEPGDSRDVNESIQAFLGREVSKEPFLEKIGVK